MSPDPVGATFAALADPTRRHVIGVLSAGEAVSATQLARELPISRQAVAKHLTALADAGLVESSRHGRETRYRLTPGPLTDSGDWIDRVGAEWDSRLGRLKRHAGTPRPPSA
jgi:DNA-binding transcriptional ArsR family regulator